MKPFLSISDQINLIKSRGMNIDNDDKTSRFLLRKNYYNTINVYGRLFDISQNDIPSYIDDSNFSEIISLYYFDKNLRNITFNKIMEFEASLKSTISHIFAEMYQPTSSYNLTTSFNLHIHNSKGKLEICPKKIKSFSYLQRTIENIFNDYYYKKPGSVNPISHYLSRGKEVPIWILINFFTFGQIKVFYELLTNKVQDKITSSFGRLASISYGKEIKINRGMMFSYIACIKDLRNRIAHDNTLIFFKPNRNIRYHDLLHKTRGIERLDPMNNYFTTVVTLQLFISKSNFSSFQNEIDKVISELVPSLISINIKDVLSKLGFSDDWKINLD